MLNNEASVAEAAYLTVSMEARREGSKMNCKLIASSCHQLKTDLLNIAADKYMCWAKLLVQQSEP